MSERKKVYLAGPMRGIPKFNFPAFTQAAQELRTQGYDVWSPHEHDLLTYSETFFDIPDGDHDVIEAKGFSLRDALYADTKFITKEADGIAMLPGWENSKGAFAEWALARALGLEVIYL